MENITSTAELKNAIQRLEVERTIKGQILKEELLVTYESLKPVNILKNTLNDMTSSPHLMNNMLGTVIGLVTGYASKKIVVGNSDNLFRKTMGDILQFGVTNLVAQHSDRIKLFSRFLFRHILKRK
jgi:hypothetical protein